MGSNQTASPRVIIIMGVSGAGKTEIGSRLAARLGGRFFDADSFHPPGNIARMSAGEPLTDADRWPWFDRMRRDVITAAPAGETWVLACSALKKSYREWLRKPDEDDVQFIFLNGDYDTIFNRMTARTDHFMREGMLRSQFATLEPPTTDEAMIVDARANPDDIVKEVIRRLGPRD